MTLRLRMLDGGSYNAAVWCDAPGCVVSLGTMGDDPVEPQLRIAEAAAHLGWIAHLGGKTYCPAHAPDVPS